jgi:hypothetical protein
VTSQYSFQALSSFCELSQNTITHNLIQLYSNQYVSTYVTPFQLFQSQTISRVSQFKFSMIESFLLSLSMIQNTIEANALLSGLQTNYKQVVQSNSVVSSPSVYSGCSCASSSLCSDQSAIYAYPGAVILFRVPGFYTGCYIIQSLLQSNLECFYSQECINRLQTYLPPAMNITALNSSLPSLYYHNSTINDVLANLMIEEWNVSIVYDRYYDQCRPTECTYSVETAETVETIEMVETRNDVTHLVALIIGVVGGVITILKLTVPQLVKFIV